MCYAGNLYFLVLVLDMGNVPLLASDMGGTLPIQDPQLAVGM
jgi:hypothetical protein